MADPPHARRFAGLTLLFLGLLGVFAAHTLAAQGKSGWAVLAVLAGVVVAIGGLRLLARESA